MVAARTWPAILAGADMSRTSSIRPTTKMAAGGQDQARAAPTSRGRAGDRPGIAAATAHVTSMATNMAAPPA